jgi:hypothetical protein
MDDNLATRQQTGRAPTSGRGDSLLVSLKELRKIETTRIETEQQEVRQKEEARIEATRARERREREEAERRRREAAEAAERAEREERLRLAEAERRARVEAEMQLEQERLRLELAATRGRPPRAGAWGTISVVLVVLLTGALGILSYELHQRSREAAVGRQHGTKLEKMKSQHRRTAQALLLAKTKIEGQAEQIQTLERRVADLRQLDRAGHARPRTRTRTKTKTKPGTKTKKPKVPLIEVGDDDPIWGIPEDKAKRRGHKPRRRHGRTRTR